MCSNCCSVSHLCCVSQKQDEIRQKAAVERPARMGLSPPRGKVPSGGMRLSPPRGKVPSGGKQQAKPRSPRSRQPVGIHQCHFI